MRNLTISLLLLLTLSPTVLAEAEAEAEAKKPAPEEVQYQQKLQNLLPSQQALFDRSSRADSNQDNILSDDEKIRLAEGDLEKEVLPRLLRILISLSSTGLLIFFTYAGVRLIAARGNEENFGKTKTLIIQGLIGACLIAGSFAIVLGIVRVFNSL